MGAVEKGLAQLKPKIFHAEVTFRLRAGSGTQGRTKAVWAEIGSVLLVRCCHSGVMGL